MQNAGYQKTSAKIIPLKILFFFLCTMHNKRKLLTLYNKVTLVNASQPNIN